MEKNPPMKRILLAGGFALLLTVVLPGSEAHAGAKDLIGKWNVVSVTTDGHVKPVPFTIEIIVTFKSGGKLAIIFIQKGKSRTKTGTYKAHGKRLAMTLDGITDKVTYRRKGKNLTLFSRKKNETTQLKKR